MTDHSALVDIREPLEVHSADVSKVPSRRGSAAPVSVPSVAISIACIPLNSPALAAASCPSATSSFKRSVVSPVASTATVPDRATMLGRAMACSGDRSHARRPTRVLATYAMIAEPPGLPSAYRTVPPSAEQTAHALPSFPRSRLECRHSRTSSAITPTDSIAEEPRHPRRRTNLGPAGHKQTATSSARSPHRQNVRRLKGS